MSEVRSFNWRGGQVTRLEALSDAVFGFAITLLVVSLEVPRDFEGLFALLQGLPAFAASFAILIMVWLYHYNFFKKYDLEDGYTIFLNSVLLFVVVFYIYPLKFVFTSFAQSVFFGGPADPTFTWARLRGAFAIYSLGFCAVFTVFTFLYHHAYRQRGKLELTAAQIVDARAQIASCIVMVGVGLVSVGLTIVAPDGIWSTSPGFVYFVIGPLQWLTGRHFDRKVTAAAQAVESGPIEAHAIGRGE